LNTSTVTTFFALLAFACNAFVIVVAVAWLIRRHRPDAWRTIIESVGPSALALGAVIAVVATLGSLYLSEVAHFTPCRMCWYQRAVMYPLAIVLPVVAWRRATRAWPYVLAASLVGLAISTYHVLLERFPTLETGACDVNNPCSIVWVRKFGVATIPYMAGSAFAAIAVAMVLAAAWQRVARKELSNVVA
jgi:disulfide bond formation protein DsbB